MVNVTKMVKENFDLDIDRVHDKVLKSFSWLNPALLAELFKRSRELQE